MRNFIQQLFFPLSPQHRKSFALLVLLSFVSMAFVVASVGAILPIVAIIISDELHQQYSWIAEIETVLGITSRRQLLRFAVSLFFILIVLKVVISVWVVIKQKELNASIRVSITDRLFRHLMAMPYLFHVRENSGRLIRNLTSDINSHARSLEASIVILSEGAMVLGLTIILVTVDPVGLAIMAILIVGVAFAYLRVVQPKLSLWGKRFRDESAAMVVHTQQALGGIKEIKVLGREQFFEGLFRRSVRAMLDLQRKFSVIQVVPVNVLEVLIGLGVLVIVMVTTFRGVEISELAPILALFMASAVRLGPSLSRIAGAVQGIRYDRPAMTALHSCLKDNFGSAEKTNRVLPTRQPATEDLSRWNFLKVEKLSFAYPMRGAFSLQDITFSLKKGGSLGIFGESGSGKTTLMDILLGLNHEYQGSVLLDCRDMREVTGAWQEQIGYVPQSVFLLDDTLRRNIALGIRDKDIDEERLENAVRRAQLGSFVASLDEGLDAIVGERGARISGGQQQRVGIARALYRNPTVLVLDEATSSLDVDTEKDLMQTVSEMQGVVTMIIIAHRLTTLKFCEQLVQLKDGQIVGLGSYQDLVGSYAST
ncbi:MAG: ABC transporter ATP-binding protein [Gammaproteobacteria bacterium]